MAETRLLVSLEEYSRQLGTHVASLRDRHAQLEAAWLRLRDIYEGEGAEVFAEAFETASARLADYTEHGAEIARQLQAKIEDLRHFQAAGPEL